MGVFRNFVSTQCAKPMYVGRFGIIIGCFRPPRSYRANSVRGRKTAARYTRNWHFFGVSGFCGHFLGVIIGCLRGNFEHSRHFPRHFRLNAREFGIGVSGQNIKHNWYSGNQASVWSMANENNSRSYFRCAIRFFSCAD